MRLSFTRLRHWVWLRLVPHFVLQDYNACGVSPSCGVGVMAGAAFCLPRVAGRIANLKTHRYIGADTLG
jgi:hypothetical protein